MWNEGSDDIENEEEAEEIITLVSKEMYERIQKRLLFGSEFWKDLESWRI